MKVFYASTLFGAMSLAAAIDDGRFGDGRRVLIVSNNAAIPEVAVPLDRTPGFTVLRSRFDEVRSWNELIAPLHPSDWRARVIEVPMTERLIRSHWGLDEVEELVLESIAVPPARTIAGLVRDCPISVYSDGLMSYGPTRDPLPAEIFRRSPEATSTTNRCVVRPFSSPAPSALYSSRSATTGACGSGSVPAGPA
ncbi:polysialyltransferase family glycosyltransferase [Nonomuraea sp. NPDC004297]